jgi:hypothetical protein
VAYDVVVVEAEVADVGVRVVVAWVDVVVRERDVRHSCEVEWCWS